MNHEEELRFKILDFCLCEHLVHSLLGFDFRGESVADFVFSEKHSEAKG